MIKRRNFLKSLAAIPLLGALAKVPEANAIPPLQKVTLKPGGVNRNHHAIRIGLPASTWRNLNEGIDPTRGRSVLEDITFTKGRIKNA